MQGRGNSIMNIFHCKIKIYFKTSSRHLSRLGRQLETPETQDKGLLINYTRKLYKISEYCYYSAVVPFFFFFFLELLKDQFKSQKGKPVPGLNDHSFFSMKSFKKGIRYNGGPGKLTQPRSHSFLILETKIKVNAGSYSLFTRIGSNFSVSSDKIQFFFLFFWLLC